VAIVAVAYVVAQFGRRGPAVRHPDVALVRSVAPRRAGWRRHLTASVVVLSLAAMVLGLARPATAHQVSRSDAVVMLALDTSLSMKATDVSPSRIQVAVDAAKDFVAQAPEGYRIGLVTYNATAKVRVPPTTDRDALIAALDHPGKLDRGTAGGDAVAASLDAIDTATSDQVTVATDDTYRSIVLLSDGDTTGGISLAAGSAKAKAAKVPVDTVAFGTPDGVVDVDGESIPVPSDPAAMAKVADATGGTTYTAQDASGLGHVYDTITAQMATTTEQMEWTVGLAVLAAIALAGAYVMSLAWAPRVA